LTREEITVRKSAFAPLVAPDTRVLLLGSLPGETSLAQQRYYAHSQNRFWHLVGKVIGVDLPALDYEDRLAALLAARIGLWDTVASARREGSLDASMRDVEARALPELTATLPNLRAVGFNGRKSQSIGMPQLADSGLALIPLPSSSPAHASMRLAEKEKLWAEIGKYLS